MSGFQWINLIWLVGALVLAVSALRVRQVSGRMVLVSILGWAAIVVAIIGVLLLFQPREEQPQPVPQPQSSEHFT